ncbi:alpha/beta hydrolase [Rhizobium sp. HT1-10]|uniref:alpha/beta hydrolase n=1 Tax=Rhizobium sp. HT1-10 TaxID=3111638 RepID=UPI003C1A337B
MLWTSIIAIFLGLFLSVQAAPSHARSSHYVKNGTAVAIGQTWNILIPVPNPKGSLVIVVGGDGILDVSKDASFTRNADNVLIRNRDAFASEGLNVLLIDKGTNLAEAVGFMAEKGRPVTVVATSAGTPRAAEGIAMGARPDRLILASGFLTPISGPGKSVSSILNSTSLLPPTLVIYHRNDACRFTSPLGVAPFLKWAGRRVEASWLDGGTAGKNPCKYDSHHGFAGLDREFVSRIARFASARE